MSDPHWYYLDELNQTLGPFTMTEIKRARPNGDVLVWKEGMKDWCPATALNVFKYADQAPAIEHKDVLLTLCKEIIADGVVSNEEIQKLRGWLDENKAALSKWPGNVLAEHISLILADGEVDESEREQLIEVLKLVTGGRPKPEQIPTAAVRLPLDDPRPAIHFDQKTFCFVGKFLFGSLKKCEAAVVSLGGNVCASPSPQTNYVVVGSIGSGTLRLTPKWEKVEKALSLKKSGYLCAIISEEDWAQAIRTEAEKADNPPPTDPPTLGSDKCGEEPNRAAGKASLVLPVDPDPIARQLQIESSSGGGHYLVDLQTHTCTCPDFVERRSQFASLDLRRACKHICTAMVRRQLVTSCDFLSGAVLSACANNGRGAPCEHHCFPCEIDGQPILITYGDSDWVNVYAPERGPRKQAAYDRFGYNLSERRWSYSTSPASSTKVKELIQHYVLPLHQTRTQAAKGPMKAGCFSLLAMIALLLIILRLMSSNWIVTS